MNFINEVLEQHEEQESPKSFWFWAALSVISTVLRDKVYLDKFYYKMYPNIYVILHAESGLKKGPPIAFAKQMIQNFKSVKLIVGRSSIQGILKEMASFHTDKETGRAVSNNAAYLCASELAASLVQDPAAMKILTDLYDRNYNFGEWQNLLKMEQYKLKDPSLTILGGINDAHAAEFFSSADTFGGLFARTCFIHERESGVINSLMFRPKKVPDYPRLVDYLKEVDKLKGEVEIDDLTRKYFDNWYRNFKSELKLNKVVDKTGTLNRFDDTVLKVALLLSIAEEPALQIRIRPLERAIVECQKLVGNIRRATHGQGKSTWAQEKSLLIHELLNHPENRITRKYLHERYWTNANVNEWDDIVTSLEAAGIVFITMVGNEICYEMPKVTVEKFRNFFSGKTND